jgi:topoisomerase IV subunit A
VEKLKGGTWQIVVTEMPYQVQKSRLVEKIAELLQAKKLLLLADVRDESTAEVRLVLEPKSRNVEPEMLMESLFRQTDLEIRFGLNMNALDASNTPRVMSLVEVLRAFLDHRREVLTRRTSFRLKEIERRLEILEGYLVAYLNLDEVIRIIREDDEPKAVIMRRFKLTDLQAESILNMRLRSLRKLEEMEIRGEHKALTAEQKDLKALLKDEDRQWKTIADQIAEMRKKFGPTSPDGKRRTGFGEAPTAVVIPLEAMMEREPVTVICSDKGWIRTIKGHAEPNGDIKFKEGDRSRFVLHAETTDKLLLLGTNGRFYTLSVDKLPGGRGHGEPLRLMIDLGNDQDIVSLFVHKPGRKLLLASSDGRGFVVPEDEVLAQTRGGKQVLNLGDGAEAQACAVVDGDHVAVVGENRKLLVFKLAEVPEMARGRGVILQKYKDGGLADVKVFALKEGLTWKSGERTRTETDLRSWVGQRAQAGRLPPRGFPVNNKFGSA